MCPTSCPGQGLGSGVPWAPWWPNPRADTVPQPGSTSTFGGNRWPCAPGGNHPHHAKRTSWWQRRRRGRTSKPRCRLPGSLPERASGSARPGPDAGRGTGQALRRAGRPGGRGLASSSASRPSVIRHRAAAILRPPLKPTDAAGPPTPLVTAFLDANRWRPARRMKHYLQFNDLSADEYTYLFERAARRQGKFKATRKHHPLVGPHPGHDLREGQARAPRELLRCGITAGGSVVHLTTGDSQLGRAEPIEDSAKVISRMVDLVMIRTFRANQDRALCRTLARTRHQRSDQRVPPCQILADIFTFIEHRAALPARPWPGWATANNMANTWLQAAALLGFQVRQHPARLRN